MKKRTVIVLTSVTAGILVLGGTAAVAGPLIYRDLIVGEAAPPPAVGESEPTTADAGASDAGTSDAGAEASVIDPADLSGSWTIAAGSYAGYRVDEVLNGTDVTVTGRTEDVAGELTVDGLTLTAAEITVDVASIATDSGARDAYFRDSAMNVADFPTATFVLGDPVTATAEPAPGQSQHVTATGELTLAGTTQEVTIELDAVLDGAAGEVAGSIPVTFSDFGVDAPDLGFVSVEPEGFIEFSLQLAPS